MAPAKRSTRRPSKKPTTRPTQKPRSARQSRPKKRATKPARKQRSARRVKAKKRATTQRTRPAKQPARANARPPVDPDATVQFSLELTQQVPVGEVLGDIEEAQALDSLTEHGQ